MPVLVDTSVWIDYFRGAANTINLESLIAENLIVTNDIILAELTPYLIWNRQKELIEILNWINKNPLDIDWDEIIQFRVKCLDSGTNGIGIPDLIIAQNVIQNECKIYSQNIHFLLLQKIIKLNIFNNEQLHSCCNADTTGKAVVSTQN